MSYTKAASCLLTFVLVLFQLFAAPLTGVSTVKAQEASCFASEPEIPQTLKTGQDFEITMKVNPENGESGYVRLVLASATTLAASAWQIPSETIYFDQKAMQDTGENKMTFNFNGSNVWPAYDKYFLHFAYYGWSLTYTPICGNMARNIRILDSQLEQVGSGCSITMPDNIKRGTSSYKMDYTAPPISSSWLEGAHYNISIGPPDRIKATGEVESFNVGTAIGGTVISVVQNALGNNGVVKEVSPPGGTLDFGGYIKDWTPGKYRAALALWKRAGAYWIGAACAYKDFTISDEVTGTPAPGTTLGPNQKQIEATKSGKPIDLTSEKCTGGSTKCTNAGGNTEGCPNGINTAIGCVSTEPAALINGLLRFASGAAGGIALILMSFAAFRMITSAGNPETLKNGQQQFTAAALGLLFILFSTILLQIIGVDILAIPGFTR